MRTAWEFQEAKALLTEVVDRAVTEGPQIITRDGTPVAVVLSAAEDRRVTGRHESLVQFLRESPLAEAVAEYDLHFSRSPDTGEGRPALD
jgi:antitoxin Phd